MKLKTTAGTWLLAACIILSCNKNDKPAEGTADYKTANKDGEFAAVSSEEQRKVAPPDKESEQKQQIPVQGIADQSPAADTVQNPPTPTTSPTTAAVANIDWDKKIIKIATVKYEVKSFDQFNKEVKEKVRKFGGYVAQEDNYQHEDRKEISLIIKVPVEQFETMMNDMQTKDIKQIERTIKTEDVTGEVIDTKSRLEAKKQMRLKYLEFLKQSKNMEEVLTVQNEINDIQEEIESAQGRVQYLTKQSAYSTINLSFYQPMEGFKAPTNDNSFWNKTGEAFSRGGEMIKGLALMIISIWPLLLAGVGGILIWRRRRQEQTVIVNGLKNKE
ncbi:MAG: DUF4349 domain-containing protein [Rhizobacter sp.]|nr:DUF4349 domain-containing protein [Ferruginibacter sp.]